jgi:UDP-N-acetylmuramate dehydrogenase
MFLFSQRNILFVWQSMKIEKNYSLEKLNTFRLPVQARLFVEYENETELAAILKDAYFREQRLLHIGGGSKLLFLNDFAGVVLHSAIKGIALVEETDETVLIHVGAAEVWDDVVAYTVDKGWGGIENLSLIPGETGAASVQNIGAYGVEIKDVIEKIDAINQLTAQKRIFSNEACKYAYRTSFFKESQQDPYIITGVSLRLQKTPVFQLDYGNLKEKSDSLESLTLRKTRNTIVTIRNQKLPDPDKWGNAGSFFMNPVVTQEKWEQLLNDNSSMPYFKAKDGNVKLSAGWLIEQCGLKGKRFGAVGVYEHQALVLVNYGGATGQEISQAAEYIREKVDQQFGILLMPEVIYVH